MKVFRQNTFNQSKQKNNEKEIHSLGKNCCPHYQSPRKGRLILLVAQISSQKLGRGTLQKLISHLTPRSNYPQKEQFGENGLRTSHCFWTVFLSFTYFNKGFSIEV